MLAGVGLAAERPFREGLLVLVGCFVVTIAELGEGLVAGLGRLVRLGQLGAIDRRSTVTSGRGHLDAGGVAQTVDEGVDELVDVLLGQPECARARTVAPQGEDDQVGLVMPGEPHRSTVAPGVEEHLALGPGHVMHPATMPGARWARQAKRQILAHRERSRTARSHGTLDVVPELPEVHALAHDLSVRLQERAVARLDIVAFSALKTYDPPASALQGLFVEDVSRHGKFLDIAVDDLHLVVHLARGGWIRWRDEVPATPPRPGKSPLAARLSSTTAPASTSPRRARRRRWPSTSSATRPTCRASRGSARTRCREDFTPDVFAAILERAGRAQIKGVLRDQSIIAGIGNAYSDEILHVAKMSPFKPAAMRRGGAGAVVRRDRRDAARGGRAVRRARGLRAQGGEEVGTAGARPRPGSRARSAATRSREVSFADSSLQYCPTCQTGGKPLADRRMSKLLK